MRFLSHAVTTPWWTASLQAAKAKQAATPSAKEAVARQAEADRITRENIAFSRQAAANRARADAMAVVRQPRPQPNDLIPPQISGQGGGALSRAEQDYMIDLALTNQGADLAFGTQRQGPSGGEVLLYGLAGLAAIGIVVLAFKKK